MTLSLLDIANFRDTYRQMIFVQKRITGEASNGRVTWIIGSDLEYAVYVEFGTSLQEAQPFLRPAVIEVASNPEKYVAPAKSLEGFVRNVAQAIKRVAKDKAPVDTGALENSIEAVRIE